MNKQPSVGAAHFQFLWIHHSFELNLFRRWQERVRAKQEEMEEGQNVNGGAATVRLKPPQLIAPWLGSPSLCEFVSHQPLESSLFPFTLSYFSLPNRPLFFPPCLPLPLFTSHFPPTRWDVHPSTDAPLIYASLHRANRSLTFCLTVQCILFPKGSIKIWYSVSQGKGEPGCRVD